MDEMKQNDNLPLDGMLSSLTIYDLLNVKDPKKFHINEAKKNIIRALEAVRIAQIDLNSIQFPKNKKLNRAVVRELSQQLQNTGWYLLSMLEGVSVFQNIKQSPSYMANDELKKLLERLRNPEELL